MTDKNRPVLRTAEQPDISLEKVIADTDIGYVLFSFDGTKGIIVCANKSFFRLIARGPEPCGISGPDIMTLMPPQSSAQLCAACHESSLSRKPFEHSFYVHLPDGTARFLHQYGQITKFKQGRQPLFFSTISDISPIRQTCQELLLTQHMLEKLLDQSGIVSWELNIPDRCIYHSSSSQRLFGGPMVLTGVPESRLPEGIDPRDHDSYLALYQRIFSGETFVSAEVRIRMADSGFRWMRITYFVISDQQGSPTRAIGASLDIHNAKLSAERYALEQQYHAVLAADTLRSYEIDLTDDLLLNFNPKVLADTLFTDGSSYSRYVLSCAEHLVHESTRGGFSGALDRQHLLQNFHNGQLRIKCEYLSREANTDFLWVESSIQLIRNPTNNHIHAFLYVRDINSRKTRELELREKARRDPLTKVLQRNTLEQEINRFCSTAGGKHLSGLIMLDVDNFKVINDTRGHTAGDKVLCRITEEIQHVFRADDLIGRIGGDEFVIFLKEIPSDAFLIKRMAELGQHLYTSLAEENSLSISCSIGGSIFPCHGKNFAELYEKADIAQYHAKKQGKNRSYLYGDFGRETPILPLTGSAWLLDEISDAIYIFRMDNYKMLYVNKTLRDSHPSFPENYQEHTCYEIIQGRTAPCPECPAKDFTSDHFSQRTSFNPVLQRHFLLKGKRIQWNGIEATMECAMDITENIEKVKALEELRLRVQHDFLTGVYNRETFYEKVSDLLYTTPQTHFVLARWDIDRFKVINDLFGTATGDRILKSVASALENYVGNAGVVARLEADHFVLCLPESLANVKTLLELVDSCIAQFQLHYTVTSAFGFYRIDDVMVPVNLMCDRAHMALRTIKGNFVRRYAWYDDNLRNNLLDEQQIVSEMDAALAEGQFEVFVQPVYSFAAGRFTSGEALVRWRHPVKGMIPPNTFIPLFERNRFIMTLDSFVWEEACRHLQRMRRERKQVLPLSINISRVNIFRPNLCDDIIKLIQKYDLPPSLLKLEITESAYTDNHQHLLEIIHVFQEYGFEILMDDFGSGYSSLNMLKDVPVDALKIDMRFLSDSRYSSRANNILTSVVRMAKWIGMSTVAEGVETQAQLEFLRSIGCDKIQGFLLARPMPLKNYEELIQNSHPSLPLTAAPEEHDFDMLWNSSPQLANFLKGMVDGVALFEMRGNQINMIRLSDSLCRFMGWDPNEFFRKRSELFSRLPEQDQHYILHACRQARDTGKMTSCILQYTASPTRHLWLQLHIRQIRHQGYLSLYYAFLTDITRKYTNPPDREDGPVE